MAENIKDLLKQHPQKGTITWIGIRPEKKAELKSVNQAEINTKEGLVGDHYHGKSRQRQVTLIQREHLDLVSNVMGKEVDPTLTRRNIVVEGINLLSLTDKRFMIGDQIILETTGHCHPCSRMEENLGPGGYNAMRGHGGLTAMVIEGGSLSVGDKLAVMEMVEKDLTEA